MQKNQKNKKEKNTTKGSSSSSSSRSSSEAFLVSARYLTFADLTMSIFNAARRCWRNLRPLYVSSDHVVYGAPMASSPMLGDVAGWSLSIQTLEVDQEQPLWYGNYNYDDVIDYV